MLRSLDIRDVLIIDRLTLEFAPGLNVLTGETGAGKSILLDALGFVLGWRGRAELVRAGAHMIKLEGGGWTAETVRFLVERGIPVCAHLGLTPQTVHALGGYRVQGRDDAAALQLKRHALELQDAGAAMLVLEMVPAALSAEITQQLHSCHTIGIGAGKATAGQVLVMHDMLGINLGKNPKFVRNFMEGAASVRDAMAAYVKAVKDGSFPDDSLHAW